LARIIYKFDGQGEDHIYIKRYVQHGHFRSGHNFQRKVTKQTRRRKTRNNGTKANEKDKGRIKGVGLGEETKEEGWRGKERKEKKLRVRRQREAGRQMARGKKKIENKTIGAK
jgi:hypothetical protein